MEMIERVEEAIKNCQCDIVKDGYKPIAKATLEAIREPTEEMNAAGARSIRDTMMEHNFTIRAKKSWRAMIDAALEGE